MLNSFTIAVEEIHVIGIIDYQNSVTKAGRLERVFGEKQIVNIWVTTGPES